MNRDKNYAGEKDYTEQFKIKVLPKRYVWLNIFVIVKNVNTYTYVCITVDWSFSLFISIIMK